MRNEFLTVRRPTRSHAEGLFVFFRAAMGIANWESKLIGVGCDGANVNMGTTGGLKGLLKEMKALKCKTLGAIW